MQNPLSLDYSRPQTDSFREKPLSSAMLENCYTFKIHSKYHKVICPADYYQSSYRLTVYNFTKKEHAQRYFSRILTLFKEAIFYRTILDGYFRNYLKLPVCNKDYIFGLPCKPNCLKSNLFSLLIDKNN